MYPETGIKDLYLVQHANNGCKYVLIKVKVFEITKMVREMSVTKIYEKGS